MKAFYGALLVVVLMAVSAVTGLIACLNEASYQSPAPSNSPPVAPIEATTPILQPKGSILEYRGAYVAGEGGDGYWGYQVTVRVQNIGADGTVKVMAVLLNEDIAKGEQNHETIVYLRQGEEKYLIFHFWVKWPNKGILIPPPLVLK